MGDGTKKAIELIEINDIVLAFDGLGEPQQKRVSKLFRNFTTEWLALSNGTRVTPGHHFLTPNGNFNSIESIIESSKQIVSANGQTIEVSARKILARTLVGTEGTDYVFNGLAFDDKNGPWETYNFEVEDLHTYIADGIRVHNKSLTNLISPGSDVLHTFLLPDGMQVALTINEFGENVTYYGRDLDGDGNTDLLQTVAEFPDRDVKIVHEERYENGVVADSDFDVEFLPGKDTGQQLGDIFGSSLGQALAGDNVFAQMGVSSVLSALLGNAGDAIHIYFRDTVSSLDPAAPTLDFFESVEAAFDSFGNDLFLHLKNSGIGSISSFLVAELSQQLDLGEGFGGQLFSSVANQVTSTAIGNIVESITTDTALNLFHGLELVNIVTSVSSFMGSYLAHEILEPETTAGAIGGSIGGTLGTAIGLGLAGVEGFLGSLGVGILEAVGLSAAIGMFSTAFAILIPGIGALVGVLLGTVLGDALAPFFEEVWDDWLGNNPPRADAWVDYNPLTGTFIADPTGHQSDGGPRDAAVGIVKVAAELLNVYREAIGGTVINNGDLRRNFYVWTDQTNMFRGPGGNFRTADEALNAGVLAMLKLTQIAGGDLYVKRAIQHSQATTVEELNGELGATPDDVQISVEGTALKLAILVDGETVRTILIEDFANKIGYQHLVTAAGTAGNDIWTAGGSASSFTDAATATANLSNDILLGGAGGDTINAGLGWDFVRGGGSNDLITGGAGNDALYGGDGNDTVYGEDNTGFAPIPTGVLSDAAVAGAPLAFDSVRRTWFGGGDPADVTLSHNYTPPPQDFNEDEIHGGAGNDQIAGGAGDDVLGGDAGADTLYGDAAMIFSTAVPARMWSMAALVSTPQAMRARNRG